MYFYAILQCVCHSPIPAFSPSIHSISAFLTFRSFLFNELHTSFRNGYLTTLCLSITSELFSSPRGVYPLSHALCSHFDSRHPTLLFSYNYKLQISQLHSFDGLPCNGGCTPSSQSRSPIPHSLPLFPFFSYSCALFCTHQNHNSFVFKRFRTLCANTRGWGRGADSFPREIIGYPKETGGGRWGPEPGVHRSPR